ncbi:MAG TPA: iron-sulfur cluster carrier protein ApbC [Rhizomicrobium sp.]|nr:iron-sulfur cluster carrier protein ApbC [Rhizomicrobium sp.]
MAATRDDVLNALSRIADPASGKNIVDAGLVQGLVLRDGNVGFSIEVAPDRGRASEPLRKAAEDAVNALPGVLSVTAVLTAHSEPANTRTVYQNPRAQRPHAGHAHAQQPQAPKPSGIEGVASVIAVASGKGGVGKSTIAVNLALGLAKLGLKVGLLDADIYGPSVPRLLNITHKPESDGHKLKPIEKFGIKTMSIGFLVAEDSPMIWRGPMVQSALTQMMNDVAWAPLDVLVIDMPPGTGDAQLTIAQRVPLKGAVIVSTPQDIALIDARKGIAMFEKTQVPVLGIVENMSMFVCPHCGHETPVFGHGGARAEAEKMNAPFLGEVPLVLRIRETSDAGTPIVASHPNGAEAQAFLAIASQVAQKIAAPSRRAPKIVME